MKSINLKKPDKIIFSGDWHGDLLRAREVIEHARENNVEYVIQLGDFGLWSGEKGSRYVEKINEVASLNKVIILWVDGNHEDFTHLYSYELEENGLREIAENIYHLPRNFQWEWDNLKFRALGGATSLDRQQRVEGLDWWSQESITYQEAEKSIEMGECDILLTHDCPEGVAIPGIDKITSLKFWPESALRTAWAHRDKLKEVVEEVRPKIIYHGHFHVKYDSTYESNGTLLTNVHGLSDNNSTLAENTLILHLSEIKKEVEEVLNRRGEF